MLEGRWDAVEGGIVLEGVAQVFDDVGNPHSHCGVQLETSLSLFVSLPRILPSCAGEANTYLTLVKLGNSEGEICRQAGGQFREPDASIVCIERPAGEESHRRPTSDHPPRGIISKKLGFVITNPFMGHGVLAPAWHQDLNQSVIGFVYLPDGERFHNPL